MTGPPPSGPERWNVDHLHGSAAELHGRDMVDDGRRHIWVLHPTGPAVVLGSTQPDATIDRAAADAVGVAIVRRRSGGGAVWVDADDPVWVDVLVPRGDDLWDDDVGRSFLPIGRAWRAALESLGVADLSVHDGRMVRTEWSPVVCFAGIGPGEVLVGRRKVVGISQRRTRAGARFQCAVYSRWDAEPLRRLLRPVPPVGVLDECGADAGAFDVGALVDALVANLT